MCDFVSTPDSTDFFIVVTLYPMVPACWVHPLAKPPGDSLWALSNSLGHYIHHVCCIPTPLLLLNLQDMTICIYIFIIFDYILASDTPILISSVENGALQRSNLLQAFHLEGWIENLQIHGTSPKGMIWQLAEGCKWVQGWGLKCFRKVLDYCVSNINLSDSPSINRWKLKILSYKKMVVTSIRALGYIMLFSRCLMGIPYIL